MSAASKVRQALDTDSRMSRVVTCPRLLLKNIALLGLEGERVYSEISDPRISKFFNVPSQVEYIENYTKEHFLKAIKKDHHFSFINSFRPTVPAYNSYIKSVYKGSKCLTRGKSSKGTFIVENEPSAVFITDQVIHAVVQAPPEVYVEVDEASATILRTVPKPTIPGAVAGDIRPIRWQYTDFPGARMFSNLKSKFTQSEFDEYTSYNVMDAYDLRETPDTRNALNSCYGQSEDLTAIIDNTTYDVSQITHIRDGYQTRKSIQQDLDIWVPLQFAWNRDISNALIVSNLDFQTMQIDLELEFLERIVRGVVGPQITTVNADGSFLYGTAADNFINQDVEYTNFNSLNIKKMELWSNNIMLDECIRDKFMDNEFKLVYPIHQQLRMTVQESEQQLELNRINYLVSELIICFSRKSQENSFRNWYKCGLQEENCIPFPIVLGGNCNQGDPAELVARSATYFKYRSLLANFKLTTKDEDIIREIEPEFYTDYLPYRRSQYRSRLSRAPESNKMLYSFSEVINDPYCIYSTSNQSRDRDFALKYNAATDANGNSLISRENPANLSITAFAYTVFVAKCGTAAKHFN